VSTLAKEAVVSIPQGRLRGRIEDGVAAFKGIPYAAPPVGVNRFLAPQPVEAWSGVRSALEYGPVVPQTPYPPPFAQLLGDQGTAGADCLSVNVWTPGPENRGLPVMVWIHGGAFAHGSGSLPVYDGHRFARDGVVCVTLNYRLGADGFLDLDEASPNRGLLDQVTALQWVQANIEAFGGNPATVTVFGESAGAFSIATLMAMPAARGLFRRAVLQSGAAHHTISKETARIVGRKLADALAVEPTLDALASVPLARFISAQAELAAELAVRPDPARWSEVAANGMLFEPVVDGDVLPERPIDAIVGGASRGREILIGTTTEEWRFFMVPTGVIDRIMDAQVALGVARRGLEAAEAIPVYRASRPDATPGDLLSAVVTDWSFRIPAVRLAEAHARNSATAFVYEFAWRSPMFDGKLGACHALDVPFVFDNLDQTIGARMTGGRAPQALANAMHQAWVAFASNGDPGWPPYTDAHRAVMRYEEDGGSLVMDPAAAERQLWDDVR
jgi:para-nitrobenzyl esterase